MGKRNGRRKKRNCRTSDGKRTARQFPTESIDRNSVVRRKGGGGLKERNFGTDSKRDKTREGRG